MTLPVLTCVTAVFNAVKNGNRQRLIRCIESVAKLKTEHEHLIYDGASTDGTVELLRELEVKTPGLRVVSESDTGIYSALNKGVRDAKGEWFYVLGDDDFICCPEKVDALLSSADDEDVIATEAYRGENYLEDIMHIFYDRSLWHAPYCHQGCLMRTQMIRSFGGFDESYRIVADYKLMLQYYLSGRKVSYRDGEYWRFAVFGKDGISSTEQSCLVGELNRLLAEMYDLPIDQIDSYRRRGYLPIRVFVKFLFSSDQALRACSRGMMLACYLHRLRKYVIPLVIVSRPIRALWRKMVSFFRSKSGTPLAVTAVNSEAKNVCGLISVVIPVYNVEKYLSECLDSLRRQSYTNWEAICVDDGSTDGSLEILRKYAVLDSRIRIYTQENYGQSVARNRGLGLANGEYCYFLDSDDMLKDDAFKRSVEIMIENRLDHLIFSTDILIDSRLTDDCDIQGYLDYYTVNPSLLNKVMSGRNLFASLQAMQSFYVQPSMRMSRLASLPHGELFPPGIVHEDCYSTLIALLAASRAMVIPDRLYIRRLHPGSTVTSENPMRTHAAGFLKVYKMLGPICRAERDRDVRMQLVSHRRYVYARYCFYRGGVTSWLQRLVDVYRLNPDIFFFIRKVFRYAARKLGHDINKSKGG